MRSGVLEWVDNVKRSRGRPKLTCDESITLDRSAWRLAITVPES